LRISHFRNVVRVYISEITKHVMLSLMASLTYYSLMFMTTENLSQVITVSYLNQDLAGNIHSTIHYTPADVKTFYHNPSNSIPANISRFCK
jgi:hypothetical protein